MTNEEIFVYVALGSVILIGSWSVALAVMLDKAHKEVAKLKHEIDTLIPF